MQLCGVQTIGGRAVSIRSALAAAVAADAISSAVTAARFMNDNSPPSPRRPRSPAPFGASSRNHGRRRPESYRLVAATIRRSGGGPVLIVQTDPFHRIGQAFFMPAQRREVEILIGGVHHVEAAREARIGMEDSAV